MTAPHRFEGGLGFNRLSILDLSRNGHQPMTAADGSIILAFNGEIYNAFDLRPALEASGFQFRTRTDTEVILRLYQQHGWEATLEHLNGMFAICIVDLQKGCMFLARDRLGVKPLYWYQKNSVFLFASETKAFPQHPQFSARLDHRLVDEQLMFRYTAGGSFLLEDVHHLEPGCWMQVDLESHHEKRFWAIPDCEAAYVPSREEAVAQLESRLHTSVRRQLLSDVKLGCQLSGGIDSSLITVLAASESDADMDAISIVFDSERFSEEKWIKQAAARGGIRVHSFTMDNDYFFDNLPNAAWSMDQPLNHPNSIGIYYIAQCAKTRVTVLLSGEGADELLGGYPRFAHAAFRPYISQLLPALRRVPKIGRRIWRRFGYADGLDPVNWFISSSAHVTPGLLRQLRPDADLDGVLARRRAIFDEGTGDYLANCLRYELRTYLVDLLIRQDKMSMAHSIENRVPFLDHEFVEFARQLPSDYHIGPSVGLPSSNAVNTKRLLKKVAEKYFDKAFTYRPKSGFAMPLRTYFCDPRFARMMEDQILPGIRDRAMIDADVVRLWWRNASEAPSDVIEALWVCVAFELWAQLHVDRSTADHAN